VNGECTVGVHPATCNDLRHAFGNPDRNWVPASGGQKKPEILARWRQKLRQCGPLSVPGGVLIARIPVMKTFQYGRIPFQRPIVLIAALSAAVLSSSAFANLIPIGAVPLSGTGLGAVNSLVTFQNTGTAVGAVGVTSTGATGTGGAFATGIPGFPSGSATNEQTSAGNNTYTAAALGLSPGGALNFSNLVLIFNGNEGGNATDQAITLSNLSLNLYNSTTGAVLGTFSTAAPYDITAFPGTGVAGFGFKLDPAQGAQANAIFASNPNLTIGGAARVTGANAGPETLFVSTLGAPTTVPESGTTVLLLGLALVSLAGLRRGLRRLAA
jgi:hypothetical protein